MAATTVATEKDAEILSSKYLYLCSTVWEIASVISCRCIQQYRRLWWLLMLMLRLPCGRAFADTQNAWIRMMVPKGLAFASILRVLTGMPLSLRKFPPTCPRESLSTVRFRKNRVSLLLCCYYGDTFISNFRNYSCRKTTIPTQPMQCNITKPKYTVYIQCWYKTRQMAEFKHSSTTELPWQPRDLLVGIRKAWLPCRSFLVAESEIKN